MARMNTCDDMCVIRVRSQSMNSARAYVGNVDADMMDQNLFVFVFQESTIYNGVGAFDICQHQ